MEKPISLGKYPKAILHIDGDAFFASCEQARNPELVGRPVITGKERGIVASLSYEAKARGICRALPIHQVKKVCPDAVILPSDYETYSLLSKRFFDIVRRYTPDVEEYSIDECFAEITGWQRSHRMSYGKIAQRIQDALKRDLGFTFSVGLASTKVLAKLASKWKKPNGFTEIPNHSIHKYLAHKEVEDIWGIGPNTSGHLNRLGVKTALEFSCKDEVWVKQNFTKPHYEIWNELNGHSVMPLVLEEKSSYYSIQKMKTFTPASTNPVFVFSQLCKNIENACMKARSYKLEATKVLVLLKTQSYEYHTCEIKLSVPTNFAHDLINLVKPIFFKLFRPGTQYRGTMMWLTDLKPQATQQDLFGISLRVEKFRNLYASIDEIRKRWGKHTVHFGSSHMAHSFGLHLNDRGDIPERKTHQFQGEGKRKRVGLPTFSAAVD